MEGFTVKGMQGKEAGWKLLNIVDDAVTQQRERTWAMLDDSGQ